MWDDIADCRKLMLTLNKLLAPSDKQYLSSWIGPHIPDTIRFYYLCTDSHRCFSRMGLVLNSFSIPTRGTHFHLSHWNIPKFRRISQRRCNTPTDGSWLWILPRYNDMSANSFHIRSIQLHLIHLDNRYNCHRSYFDEFCQYMNNLLRRYRLRSWPYHHKPL